MFHGELELEAELEKLMGVLAQSGDLEEESEMLAPQPAPPVVCNIKDLPSPQVTFRALSGAKLRCPNRSDAQAILSVVVGNAVRMLDNTIGELSKARQAFCQGKPLGWPNISDVTACWLKYKLGICIDNPSVWSDGAYRPYPDYPTSIQEVIRRLMGPRNLLANNEVQYICEPTCGPGVYAWTRARFQNGRCIPGTPNRVIHLCPYFWSKEFEKYREQGIIHEAVHLTHCAEHVDDTTYTSIGSAVCLSEFVMATNGRELIPNPATPCGFTNRCGAVPANARERNCGGVVGSVSQPPDWAPTR